jgi:hypothetical protein
MLPARKWCSPQSRAKLTGRMAERGGHAPHHARRATISLAQNPGSLVRFTFHNWCPWQSRAERDSRSGLLPSKSGNLHLHWSASEADVSALDYTGVKSWCSRQEFRLQPPRSKRGALYIELREHRREKAEAGGHAPHPAVAGRSVFETVPARLSGSASYNEWSLRLDSHQHLTAYETAALLLCYGAEKWCRPAAWPVSYEAGGTDEVPFTSALRNASY